jgi:hypothetical protein
MMGTATDSSYLRSVINALLQNPKYSFLKALFMWSSLRTLYKSLLHTPLFMCYFETETYMPETGSTTMNNEL